VSERFSLVVFRLHDRLAAFPAEAVERVTPMAELLLPPGLPAALEGVLNLGGVAVPVISLDRLFRLPPQKPGLYSMLVVLRLHAEGRIAVVVDRVTDIVQAQAASVRPIDREDTFNGCAEAIVDVGAQPVHLLSPARIVLAKERDTLAEFREIAQHRLREWQAVRA
jgi:purine-binding chemotaxis protein CheW